MKIDCPDNKLTRNSSTNIADPSGHNMNWVWGSPDPLQVGLHQWEDYKRAYKKAVIIQLCGSCFSALHLSRFTGYRDHKDFKDHN
ncbi:hypothetical protein AAES_10984 [Amazona aestiva]|uniref:Uncharacterized protein n=1 Tax=Amazona aestiva TaxID=12930 RepID=A0A0Q3U1T3_AMAAE|nr:hypothetical protein AAES_10984 [Amazona aestiva]